MIIEMNEDEKALVIQVREEKIWHRKCLAILVFHTFQQLKYEDKRGTKWTLNDSARILHLSIGYISESIKLAKFMPRMNGELEKLTRDLALKRIKEYEESTGIS